MSRCTNKRWRSFWSVLACVAIAACSGGDSPTAPTSPPPTPNPPGPPGPGPQVPGADTVRISLSEMGTRTYKGFTGGLYPTGNALSGAHLAAGLTRAASIRPLDTNGQPSASGRIVLISIGMSNTTQEFCGDMNPCAPWSFIGQAAADQAVNHTTLAIIDGAIGGHTADDWDSLADTAYNFVRDRRLAPRGLTERQVQVVWMKVAHSRPTTALPNANADAHLLSRRMADIARTLKVRYPNVQQIFVSSRIYGGYATTALNPEPYAYESGFAVKWLVEAQINQVASGAGTTPNYGDLSYNRVTPWLAWAAYLWADGSLTRPDGLAWLRADFAADGTHPSQSGEQKVGLQLLTFFKTSPVTSCWFLAGRTC